MVRGAIAWLALLAVASCAGDADRQTEGGELPTWDLTLLTRIGSLDDPDLGLTQVTAVAFGPDARLYIAQSSEREIRLYDLTAGLIRRIGRDGEGPGEFRSVYAMVLKQDTLIVPDGSLRRVSHFTLDGDFIESYPWTSIGAGDPRPPVFYLPTPPTMVLPDGSGIVQQMYGYMPGEIDEIRAPWLRVSRDMSQQDTIVVQVLEVRRPPSITEGGRTFSIFASIRETPLYEQMADGSGIAVIERPFPTSSDQHLFRLLLIDPAGDTVWTREYPYMPIRTPDGEVDRQTARLVQQFSELPESPSAEAIRRAFIDNDLLPEFLAPVQLLRTGQDGWVWLQREGTGADSTVWNAIDPQGEPRGSVRLPAASRIMAARGDLLAVLERDEFDVPYVVVNRIVR